MKGALSAATIQEKLGYKKTDILVIIHVDDLGMHKDETDGGIEVINFGLARTGSVMVPAPDFERFTGVWRANPTLDIGVHVTITSEWKSYRWAPLLSRREVPSLYDPEGFLWKNQKMVVKNVDWHEAVWEMEAQVEKVIGMGLAPTHIDAHMGCLFLDKHVLQAAVKIARKHNLVIPCWAPTAREYFAGNGLIFLESLYGIYNLEGEEKNPQLRKDVYCAWMKSLGPGVHYIYTHPAHVTQKWAAIIEKPYIRSGDLSFWTSPETKKLAEDLGIHFIGLRELQEVQVGMLC